MDKKSDITEYVLYYGPTEQYLQEPGGRFNITTDVANTTASIEVTPLTMYTFQVVAVNREGLVSPPSLLINATTLPPRKYKAHSACMLVMVAVFEVSFALQDH